MKKKTSRRKKTLQESSNIILCNKLTPQRCERCGEWKEVVSYVYKNIAWNKTLLEMKACKDCIIEYKEILKNLGDDSEDKKKMIPILEAMIRIHDGLPMYDVKEEVNENQLKEEVIKE